MEVWQVLMATEVCSFKVCDRVGKKAVEAGVYRSR